MTDQTDATQHQRRALPHLKEKLNLIFLRAETNLVVFPRIPSHPMLFNRVIQQLPLFAYEICVKRVSETRKLNEMHGCSPTSPSWCTDPIWLLPEHLLKEEAGSRSVSSSSKTNTLLLIPSPKMSCHGVQACLCIMPVHLVRSTVLTLPAQGVRANMDWTSTALWVSVTGLWWPRPWCKRKGSATNKQCMASFRWAVCHRAPCQQFSPLESK